MPLNEYARTIEKRFYATEKWYALIADKNNGTTEISAYSFDDVMSGVFDYKKRNETADIINIYIYSETVKE